MQMERSMDPSAVAGGHAATKLPVVDGVTGADIYGDAATEAEAVRVAEEYFADEVVWARIDGPIDLREGGSLPLAWVALTMPPPVTVRLFEGEARQLMAALDAIEYATPHLADTMTPVRRALEAHFGMAPKGGV